jgi:hypothetical protein
LSDEGDATSSRLVHPDEVHSTRRRLELWVVGITAAAALVAALLSLYASRSVASFQADAENERVQRTERLEAYSSMLTATEPFIAALARSAPCAPAPPLGRPGWLAATEQQFDQVRAASVRVYLVGSPAAATAADALQDSADNAVAGRLESATLEEDACREQLDTREDELNAVIAQLSTFGELARRDLDLREE